VYRKLSQTQRELRVAEKDVAQLRSRLEATQRLVPESREFTEELMHAYRKMGQAQDAEYAVKMQLQRSEAMNTTLRDQLEAFQHQIEQFKLLVHEKEDIISRHGSQMTVLRKETDSLHRTLLRREEEVKLLTAKLGSVAQDKDAISRIKSAMESDIAAFKSTIKAKDATISDLQRSKIELQKKLEAARQKSERHSSMQQLTSIAASNSQAQLNQRESASIASSMLSLIGLGSKPAPSSPPTLHPPHNDSHHSSSHSTDTSSADNYSIDPSYRSYSTENGEIFKLTDDGIGFSPGTGGDSSSSNINVGIASLKIGELKRRIDPGDTPGATSFSAASTATTPISSSTAISSHHTSESKNGPTAPSMGSGPPLPKGKGGITFTFTTTLSSSTPLHRASSSYDHMNTRDSVISRPDCSPSTIHAQNSLVASSSSTSLISPGSDSPGISPSGSSSSLPSITGTQSPSTVDISLSSGAIESIDIPMVFNAAAEARLLEIQRKLDDTSSMWNSSSSSGNLSQKKMVQLPTKVFIAIQPLIKSKASRVSAACVDPTGVKLVAGGENALCLYDALHGGGAQKTFKSSPKSITSVCYDETGTLLLAAATDRTARVWFPTSSTPCTINHATEVYAAVFCGSSTSSSSSSSSSFRSSLGGTNIVQQTPSSSSSTSITGEKSSGSLAPIIPSSPVSSHLPGALSGNGSTSTSSVVPSHARIATICRNRTLSIWDVSSSTSYRFLFSHPFKSLSYAMCANPITSLVYTGHLDKQVRVFDAKRGEAVSQFDTQHTDCITGLQLSTDGSKIYTTSRDGTVCCYDTANTNKILATFTAPNLSIDSNWARATLSPTGQHIALGSSNGKVFIWDTQTTKLVTTLNASSTAVSGITWNPLNYNNLVTFDDHGVISIWN